MSEDPHDAPNSPANATGFGGPSEEQIAVYRRQAAVDLAIRMFPSGQSDADIVVRNAAKIDAFLRGDPQAEA